MQDIETLKRMFDQFHEAIYIVDTNRQILYFNPMAAKLSGFAQNEMELTFCYDNKLNHIDEKGNNLCINGCPLVASIANNRVEDHFVYMHHKNGHRVRVHVRTIPHTDNEGRIDGAIEVFTDVTSKKLVIEELKIRNALAYIDAVTDTFNRHYLNQEVPKLLAERSKSVVAVVFFDIDQFKHFNDQFGHRVGDTVLQEISKTVSLNVADKDVFVRYGGDEFIIIFFDDTKEKIIKRINLLNTLLKATIIRRDNQEYRINVSLGYTIRKSNEEIAITISRADEAMYVAKKMKDGVPQQL